MLRPVILCGGSGTRLWPLSRGLYPKQFMDIGGETIFGKTLDRVAALPDAGRPIIVCNEEHRFLAAAILQEKGMQADILLEPLARNTAPAIAVAAFAAKEEAEDVLLLVLPSDHVIEPVKAFADCVATAAKAAAEGALVTFGVTPSGLETGYGYIKQGLKQSEDVYKVARFVEKPTREKAVQMLQEGGYTWNSGMFLFQASAYLAELEKFSPEIYSHCAAAWGGHSQDFDFIRLGGEFKTCPSDSIDYAVMERTDLASVVPLAASWSDLGSWQAFYECAQHDANENACVGDVLAVDSSGCYVHAASRLVSVLGVKDLCVIETPDAVLVLDRERSQEVKGVLERLKKQGRAETDTHLLVHRPWGTYETLVLAGQFQVKRIIVKPGSSLSLQKHHHRAEHWVVVRGTANVFIDGKELTLSEDMSTYIPLGVKHRLSNPGRIPLEIIEIQTGSYLGEDDIVRFDDIYGRNLP